MPVQDLTPQLRTRLSRVERGVGWFVILATLVLLGGFGYYIYHTAENKGWFYLKVPYHTYLRDAAGLKLGDPVHLMGFDVGEIVEIEGTEAGKNWFTDNHYNVFVKFRIREPYYGYIWTDSKVRVGTGDFLGKRGIEVMKGSTGEVTVTSIDPLLMLKKGTWENPDYVTLVEQPEGPWLLTIESPPLNERLDQIADQVQQALPGIFHLTNQLAGVLTNTANLTAGASEMIQQARPLLLNLAAVSATLTNGNGALGELLIPTNLNLKLLDTLNAAESVMVTTDTNIAQLTDSVTRALDNVANLTSNLNAQVQANDQILSQISSMIVQADQFVQGLRRHWLLRSAFRSNAPPSSSTRPGPGRPRAGPKTGKYQPP